MDKEFDPDTVFAPRLIRMQKGSVGGYGFNLHGERNNIRGQTISAVDDGSVAQIAGLRVGDRVIEVNAVNVELMSHGDVVKRIKVNPSEVTMLVIDAVTEAYLKSRNQPITADMADLNSVYDYPPKEVESAEPTVLKQEESVPEVQDQNSSESEPPPTEEPANGKPENSETITSNNNEEEKPSKEASDEVANDETTPEEVKQLNDVLDKEDSSPPPEPTPEPTPEPIPEPTTTPMVQTNGTAVPAAAPEPAPTMPTPTRPTSKPLRSTIKQVKTESWDDKYRKFQEL